MNIELNTIINNHTASAVLRLLVLYPKAKEKMDVVVSYSEEQLEALLKSQKITDELMDYVASEDDAIIIQRVIKLTNLNYKLSEALVDYARTEDKFDFLVELAFKRMGQVWERFHETMSISQMKEISEAVRDGVSFQRIERYMWGLEADQMFQMRCAFLNSSPTTFLDYMYTLAKNGLSGSKLREIRKAYEDDDLEFNEIKLLNNERFSEKQMHLIRKTFKLGADKAMYLIKSDFDEATMEVVKTGFEAGLTVDEVKVCATYDIRFCRKEIEQVIIRKLSQIM